MCGIAGFFDPEARFAPAGHERLVRRMADTLAHRGPDDAGTWTDGAAGIALGARRLAIVDLSAEGHQPMVSADSRWVVAFNGEIYNWREVRRELEASAPVRWRGHADTEVLVEAVARWGLPATLERLDGMFAIALWDRQRRRLFLARDRLGEKPLYYGWLGGVLVFGSELKALAAHPMWSGEIDRTALALYLRHAYVPAPFSAYREVRKLPPGHFLVIEAGGQPAAPTAYWAAPARFAAVEPFAGTADEAAERLAELVRRSVGLRMLADVPVGMFLSGGIDSSTVAAAMQAQAAGRVHTYSIGFAEQRYDESAHAAAVARALGTEHTELRVGDAECRAVVPRLAAIYDEPFADASQIPTLVLSELTRRHVTVALSGDGGDELFGGYPRYRLAARRWQRHAALPAPLRRAARAFVDVGGPQALTRALGRPGRKLARAIEDLGAASPERLYRNMVSLWRDADGLTRRPPASPFDGGLALPDGCGPEQRLMFLDALTYLPDDLLVKVDRASMAASLEARAPLLDHKIVEFAWSLPGSICFHDGAGKWPLRQVLYQAVPRALVDRPKQGFEPPLGDWLRGPLRDWAEALLSPRALAADGLVEPGPVRARWREHLSGRRNRAYALWVILMLQAWRAKPLRP